MQSAEGLCGDMVQLKVPIRVSVSYGKSWGHLNPYQQDGTAGSTVVATEEVNSTHDTNTVD